MESICKSIVLGDSTTVEFPRLVIGDLLSLGDQVVAQREKVARDLARDEKLDRIDTINLILELRKQRPTIGEMLESTKTPEGSIMVLKRSLSKAKVEAARQDEILGLMSIPDCVDVAQMLIFDVQETKAKEEAKGESPLPAGSPS